MLINCKTYAIFIFLIKKMKQNDYSLYLSPFLHIYFLFINKIHIFVLKICILLNLLNYLQIFN